MTGVLVSIEKMSTSHQTEPITYYTCLRRANAKPKAMTAEDGFMTAYQSTSIDKVRFDAEQWAEFFQTTIKDNSAL